MNFLIIGAGLSSAACARTLAEAGHKIEIWERRSTIGGNCYDYQVNNISIHKYGPHIFHTNNEKAYAFISRFTKLNNFVNEVQVVIDKKVVPMPFNFKGIETFFPDKANKLKTKLAKYFPKQKHVFIFELQEVNDDDLQELARFIFENIYQNYSAKMWGVSIDKIDLSVLKRVPINLSYDTRYFRDKYEGIPDQGYTNMIKKMFDHPNIDIKLNRNALDSIAIVNNRIIDLKTSQPITRSVIFCGPIDELFKYQYGYLPYRSLNIKFETLNQEKFQDCAVINYPAHPTMTRITEYKYFRNDKSNKTIISREYPGAFDPKSKEFDQRFYPMPSNRENKTLTKYKQTAQKIKNLFLLGRLAQYKYINMDQAIGNGISLARRLHD